MAAFDFGSLDNLYRQYLNRGASQDEYTNWSTGKYGATDLGGIESQIKNSGEAQAYRASQAPKVTAGPVATSPYGGGTSARDAIVNAYRTDLGRKDAEITDAEVNNWLSGSYGGSGLSDWLNQIKNSGEAQTYRASQAKTTGGGTGAFDPRTTLSAVFAKYGLDPTNPGYGLGNIDYFLGRGGETGGGWGNPSNQQYWQDRTAQEIEKALYGRMGNLVDTGGGGGGYQLVNPGARGSQIDPSQMFTDPATQQFQSMILDRINNLYQAVQRPDDSRYRDAALARVDELMKDPYTSEQEAAIRARMMAPLTQARDARIRDARERMAARNIGPSSGLFEQQVYNQPELDYERSLAGATNDIATSAIAEKENRRAQALSLLSSLVGLGSSNRSEDQARADTLLTTGAILPDMSERRLNQLMQVYGTSTATMPTLVSTLTNIMGLNQRTSEFNSANDANNAAMWGQVFGYLLNSPLLTGATA